MVHRFMAALVKAPWPRNLR